MTMVWKVIQNMIQPSFLTQYPSQDDVFWGISLGKCRKFKDLIRKKRH